MPSWPGRWRRLHNSDFNPRKQLGSADPLPPACWGSARGGGSPGGPLVVPGALYSSGSRGSERERSRWLEAKRSAGRGRRAAGDALFVWFAPGTGLAGDAGRGRTGRRAPGGLRCGAGAVARGERDRWGGGGPGAAAGGVGQEAPGKEPPARSSHHYRAAFLRMALPRVAQRRGSAPQTRGRPPAL